MATGQGAARFDAALARAGLGEGGSPDAALRDFSKMTRGDLFGWMNERIKAGELSLDDSAGLLALSGGGGIGAIGSGSPEAVPPDDQERVNFFQLAQDRIAAARHRREHGVEAAYLVALGIMQLFQAPS
ncbi:MAG: hypothetical protein ACT6Q5_08155 [Sphingopyxis solisilvae]|uniref:hypothetical protein n=1 Tax=Sphingopyxis solisilvae TaxID=1886788 RepID=UPI0040361FBD